jgi:hypothetical protein
MRKTLLTGLFICLQYLAPAQMNNLEQLGQQFFDAFRFNDSTAYLQCFTTAKEINRLAYQQVKLQGEPMPDSNARVLMTDITQLLKRAFYTTRKRFIDSGVNWGSVQLKTFYYNIIKDKGSLYASARGELVFESGDRQFSLQLYDMIFMDNRWKIISYRPAHALSVPLTRVSYYAMEDDLFTETLSISSRKKEEKKPKPEKKDKPLPVVKKPPVKRN